MDVVRLRATVLLPHHAATGVHGQVNHFQVDSLMFLRFDTKMTYHHDSLVQVTFTCPWGNINTFLDPPPPKSNDKIVVFMGSNCVTGILGFQLVFLRSSSPWLTFVQEGLTRERST